MKWPVINDNVTFRGSCGNLSGVKWIGGYPLHLCASALVVPGLTLLLVSVGFWFVHRLLDVGDSPQQFYSDYFLLMAVIVGLGLAYTVCDTFTAKGAVWVWIPFTLIFAVHVLTWETSGSVLFQSGFISHFFTANCQIARWAEPGFISRCSDKLFLTQLFVGTLAYSCGAFIYNVAAHRASRTTQSASA